MSKSARILRWFGLVLGVLGVLGCAGLTVGVWVGEARLSRAIGAVFEKTEETLGLVHGRIGPARQRLDGARITSEEMGETLKRWTKREAARRAAGRLELEEKAVRIGEVIDRADGWMETSAASVELVSEIITSVNDAGASIPTDTLGVINEEIVEIRAQLDRLASMVAEIRNLTAADGDAQPPAGRLEQASRIALRVAASLGVLEKTFRKVETQINTVQEGLEDAENRLQRWIVLAAIALTFVLVWMGAGQAALVWTARKRMRDEG